MIISYKFYGSSYKNLVAITTWRMGFLYTWPILGLCLTICTQQPRKFTKLQLRMVKFYIFHILLTVHHLMILG